MSSNMFLRDLRMNKERVEWKEKHMVKLPLNTRNYSTEQKDILGESPTSSHKFSNVSDIRQKSEGKLGLRKKKHKSDWFYITFSWVKQKHWRRRKNKLRCDKRSRKPTVLMRRKKGLTRKTDWRTDLANKVSIHDSTSMMTPFSWCIYQLAGINFPSSFLDINDN